MIENQALRTFISYAREDLEFTLKLAADLRQAKANIWLDRFDIPVGTNWPKAIEKALAQCPRFLVVLSAASVESSNVIAELDYAIEEEKQIFPVLREDCRRPFRVRAVQYADFTGDYQSGLSQLLGALEVKQEKRPHGTAVTAPQDQISSPFSPGLEGLLQRLGLPTAHLGRGVRWWQSSTQREVAAQLNENGEWMFFEREPSDVKWDVLEPNDELRVEADKMYRERVAELLRQPSALKAKRGDKSKLP